MQYRLAKISDIYDVFALIRAAIVRMEEDDIHQWDDIYPTKEDFISDIANKSLYIAEENGRMVAIYVISAESDEAYKTADSDFSVFKTAKTEGTAILVASGTITATGTTEVEPVTQTLSADVKFYNFPTIDQSKLAGKTFSGSFYVKQNSVKCSTAAKSGS